jgi:RNA polymerase sigma-70 factor, ECF subfamily
MIRKGGLERAALEQLYVRLEKPLFNVVYRWVWDAEMARDLVQEAFERLWKHRARVEPATAEALVYRTALNLAANRRRANKLWRWLSLEGATAVAAVEPAAQERLERAQADAEVRRAVESLPEPMRRVLLMCEFSGMKYEEIASILGIPAGTVASRRHAAMRRLEDELVARPAL